MLREMLGLRYDEIASALHTTDSAVRVHCFDLGGPSASRTALCRPPVHAGGALGRPGGRAIRRRKPRRLHRQQLGRVSRTCWSAAGMGRWSICCSRRPAASTGPTPLRRSRSRTPSTIRSASTRPPSGRTSLMAHSYSHLFQLPTTGARFFTVYGPWGRPGHGALEIHRGDSSRAAVASVQRGPHDARLHVRGRRSRGGGAADRAGAPAGRGERPRCGGRRRPAPRRRFGFTTSATNIRSRLLDLIRKLERCVGRPAELQLMPMQPGDVRDTCAKVEALAAAVQFSPGTSIDEGLAQYVRLASASTPKRTTPEARHPRRPVTGGPTRGIGSGLRRLFREPSGRSLAGASELQGVRQQDVAVPAAGPAACGEARFSHRVLPVWGSPRYSRSFAPAATTPP